jgi:hypothetical protein
MSYEEKVFSGHGNALYSHQIFRVGTRLVEIMVHVLHGETDDNDNRRSAYAIKRSIDFRLGFVCIDTLRYSINP